MPDSSTSTSPRKAAVWGRDHPPREDVDLPVQGRLDRPLRSQAPQAKTTPLSTPRWVNLTRRPAPRRSSATAGRACPRGTHDSTPATSSASLARLGITVLVVLIATAS